MMIKRYFEESNFNTYLGCLDIKMDKIEGTKEVSREDQVKMIEKVLDNICKEQDKESAIKSHFSIYLDSRYYKVREYKKLNQADIKLNSNELA